MDEKKTKKKDTVKAVSSVTLGLEELPVIEPETITDNEDEEQENHPNFIESNTSAISLEELQTKNIIPTFVDGNLTISHQNFIGAVEQAASKVFGEMTPVEIRVSHPIIGRVPGAQLKKADELSDDEKTIFFQRMAFVSHVQNLTRSINGQTVYLCVGGVRAYNDEKLYNKQSSMKFKIFCGWQVRVCSNLMLTCDGNSGTIECMTSADIKEKAEELFTSFDPHKEDTLRALESLHNTRLSEEQFCKIMGRLRLYQFLPVSEQKQLPQIPLGDQNANSVVKGYVSNPEFGKKEGEDITTWNLLQLFTEAVKQSNIDRWLTKNQGCVDFAMGIQDALNGEQSDYDWFLN